VCVGEGASPVSVVSRTDDDEEDDEDEEKEELAGAVDGREEVARAPERGIRVARSEIVRRGGVQSEKGDRLVPDLWRALGEEPS